MPVNETGEDQITTDSAGADTEDEENSPERRTGNRFTDDGATGHEAESITMSSAEEELTLKLTEMHDRYLRLTAEYDNYRKRTLREKIELTQTGGESVIVRLLPVIDDIDRAMESIRSTDECEAVKTGLELIYNKIYEFLRQSGVKEIEAINEPFNSDLHEAVTMIAVNDKKQKGSVIEVTQKGYTLHDKVIRYPKVIVGE